MPEVHIYNLNLGDQEIGEHDAKCQIGPFHMAVIPDYLHKSKKLPRNAVRVGHTTYEVDKPTVYSAEEFAAVSGELTATATVSYFGPTGERSILCETPEDDEGLFDLCTLLSFINGRPVTCDALLAYYQPNISGIGNAFGYHIESPQITACVWEARGLLHPVRTAIHYYNGGIENMPNLNGAASLFFTALNVLWDKTEAPPYPKLGKQARKALIDHLTEAMGSFPWPDDEHKTRYETRIKWAITEDKPSATMRITEMLNQMGVVNAKELADDAIERRVKYIASFRNLLLHCGKIPEIKGIDARRVLRAASLFGLQILPTLIQLRVLQLAGCTKNGSHHQALLREYFLGGTWQGYDPHSEDLMDFLDRVAPLEDPEPDKDD